MSGKTAELEEYQQRDLQKLESLFLAQDPRTIPQIIEEDKYGISGHQFDFACGMALAVAEGNEI